jgi:hypothetical protein
MLNHCAPVIRRMNKHQSEIAFTSALAKSSKKSKDTNFLPLYIHVRLIFNIYSMNTVA